MLRRNLSSTRAFSHRILSRSQQTHCARNSSVNSGFLSSTRTLFNAKTQQGSSQTNTAAFANAGWFAKMNDFFINTANLVVAFGLCVVTLHVLAGVLRSLLCIPYLMKSVDDLKTTMEENDAKFMAGFDKIDASFEKVSDKLDATVVEIRAQSYLSAAVCLLIAMLVPLLLTYFLKPH